MNDLNEISTTTTSAVMFVTVLLCGYVLFYSSPITDMNDLTFRTFIAFVVIAYSMFFIAIQSNVRDQTKEHLSTISNEALNDLASVYNKGNMVVTNLTVDGQLNVNGSMKSPSATIGNWNIRNDSIGIPSKKDINMTDWIRIYDYGTNDYSNTGIASKSFWENDALLTNKYVQFNSNVSAKPINDFKNCFDFGSDHRTSCGNNWSIVQMIPR
ncbi:hypothetical protein YASMINEVIRUS_1316 [Yasminevirus sp. GU-2018]|uniref:Uncharacterized protein n=1 Tax=Yasminevirus sp. GU-2018 TaxID=2420051 RepID=A0A5K0UBA2_9VIRU|nr:hypothetical protein YASMINEVIRUS_1316 [Yasminevirus sp. GU-2018]